MKRARYWAALGMALACSAAAALAQSSGAGAQAASSNPCVAPANLRIGGSAYWVRNSFDAFNRRDYAGAIANVNACLGNWRPQANVDQADADARHDPQPEEGVVNEATMRRVLATHPLLHDVGASLWILGRSHHMLDQRTEARQAYEQCISLTRARVWDTAGWLWAPARDCRAQRGAL